MRRVAWALALLLALPALALACPGCKEAFGDNPESAGFAKGIYITVVGMLTVVFSLVGIIIYKIVQEARRETRPSDPGQSPSA